MIAALPPSVVSKMLAVVSSLGGVTSIPGPDASKSKTLNDFSNSIYLTLVATIPAVVVTSGTVAVSVVACTVL